MCFQKRFFLALLAFPLLTSAQRFTPLQQPIPPGANLLQVGHNIVLIHALEPKNFSHKWVSFDSSLNILIAKKIVSPDWQNIVSQTYITTSDAVVRVDQLLFNDSLYISLVRFDAFGTPTNKIEIAHIGKQKIDPLPFFISQSVDRKYISLVQPATRGKDKISLVSFVLDDMLNMVGTTKGEHTYDPLVFEILPPIVDSDGMVYVPLVDKFTSYRLGTTLQLLPLSTKEMPYVTIPFDRKKLKDLRLQVKDGLLKLRGLYSITENKSDIAGAVFATVPINDLKQAYFSYSPFDESRKSLSKKIATDGRKGSLLNYLHLLPTRELQEENNYGVLFPEAIPGKGVVNTPNVANASADLDQVKRQVAAINSMAGGTRRRSASPSTSMSYAEASVYAATVEKTVGNGGKPTSPLPGTTVAQGNTRPDQQLLYFTQNGPTTTIQVHKIRPANDPLYDFFAYAEVNGRYHAINYHLPSLKRAQLMLTSLDTQGKPVKKILLEDKTRVLQEGFPTLIFHGSKLIAVFEDRLTSQMGLVAIPLDR